MARAKTKGSSKGQATKALPRVDTRDLHSRTTHLRIGGCLVSLTHALPPDGEAGLSIGPDYEANEFASACNSAAIRLTTADAVLLADHLLDAVQGVDA